MDLDQIALSVVALCLAGIIKGATGLGYSTTALPMLALVAGLKIGMPARRPSSRATSGATLRGSVADEPGVTSRRFPC